MILDNRPTWRTIIFYVFIFIFNSLHVSSISCSSSGETNCINTTSGSCHSVLVAVSCAGRKWTSDLVNWNSELPTCTRNGHRHSFYKHYLLFFFLFHFINRAYDVTSGMTVDMSTLANTIPRYSFALSFPPILSYHCTFCRTQLNQCYFIYMP